MSAAPPYVGSTGRKTAGPLLCKWSGCEAYENSTEFVSVEELARHVRTTHVEPLESQDVVVCQWEKCKVYNVPSSSIQWLKRHVQQAHTKDRPFKCIMNGCIMAFNSREALQRHVNRHLEPPAPPVSNTPGTGSLRQPHTKTGRGAHIHTDVWDRKMMSVVGQTCRKLSQDTAAPKGLSVTLKAKIVGKRCTSSKGDEFLVRWTPHLADDCWVPISQFSAQKSLPLTQISEPYLSRLISSCFTQTRSGRNRRKRKL